MISSNSRKIISLAASGLLVGGSLVMGSAPATAAAGDVTIKPTTGDNYAVFNDDAFELTTVVNSATIASDATLAYAISNPDQHAVIVDFGRDEANATLKLAGAKSTGESVEVISASEITLATTTIARANDGLDSGAFLVDFAALDITSLVIHEMDFTGDLTPTFQIVEDSDSGTNSSGELTSADYEDLSTDDGAVGNNTTSGLNDGNKSITVQAWIDVNADVTDVDASYASDAETITFYDPANVSVISKLERLTATGRTFGTAIEGATDATSRQDFLMDVDGATDSNALVGSMKFNVSMNFAQIDLSDFKIGMTSTNASTTTMARTAISELAAGADDALDTNGQIEVLTASNGKSADKNGELLFRAFANGAIFAAGDKYQVSFQHSDTDSDSNAAAVYESPQFTVSNQTVSAGADGLSVTVAPSASSSSASGTVGLRPGVQAFTYTAQVLDAAADVEEANIPVIARVEAGSFLPSGETLKVSGTTKVIDQANEAVFVSGLSDSDGHFSVTVTADAAAAATTYNVQFYVVDGGTTSTVGDLVAATEQVATYNAVGASTFTASNDVASASEVTLSFTVKDAFGAVVDTSATGKQYSVELKAPDTDDLKAYAVVEDGVASFTFTNWLTAGESNVLTAKLYTGTSTTPVAADYVSGKTANVTLYSPVAATSVLFNLDEVSGLDVEMNDFITGTRTNVGPVSETNGATLAGSVVDANGAGIPGAPVTLTAEGVQFLSGSTYSIGSVDLVTDASGAFTAEAWTHVKSSTGVTVTATTGSLTDTMLIKTDLPATLNRGNLVFEVDMPDNVVVNTTYAVTASVMDVFGNPVDGATIKFDGFGSAQFNGVASVTKNTNRNGEAVVYLRSLKDIDGLSAVEISVTDIDHDGGGSDISSIDQPVTTDVATTSWDETAWSHLFETEVNFLETAPASSTQKVNAGSFKGYVAVYALGYEGQRLSAKIGNDWVIVDPIVNNESANLARVTDFTGAGVDIQVRIYIDRVLVDTIPLTTK